MILNPTATKADRTLNSDKKKVDDKTEAILIQMKDSILLDEQLYKQASVPVSKDSARLMKPFIDKLVAYYFIPISPYVQRRFSTAVGDTALRGDTVDVEEYVGRVQWWAPKGELPLTDTRCDAWDKNDAMMWKAAVTAADEEKAGWRLLLLVSSSSLVAVVYFRSK